MADPKLFVFASKGKAKRHAPATARNRDAIAAILRDILPQRGLVLEIASGTGEHAAFFAAQFPDLVWQPSDPDPAGITSIKAWSEGAALINLRPPLQIDARTEVWPINCADAILCINMVHISPWSATLGLIENAARILPVCRPLYLYGPYRERGVETAQSNEVFDQSLRSRNAEWGLRWVHEVVDCAAACGFKLDSRTSMPANNLSLVFRKQGE